MCKVKRGKKMDINQRIKEREMRMGGGKSENKTKQEERRTKWLLIKEKKKVDWNKEKKRMIRKMQEEEIKG